MMHILGALLVAVVMPVVLVGAVVGELGAGAMLVGLLLGAVGSKIGGTRRTLYLTPAIGLAAWLGALTAYDWWWVALLAVAAVIAGAGIGAGWLPALLMIPFAETFAAPTESGRDALAYGVIVALGALYGIVLARRFGAAPVVEGQRLPRPAATGVAIVFGLVLGASAAIGVALGWTEPYWVPEPVLILVLYILMGKRERIRGKALGTALGAGAAIPVAILAPPAWVIALLATVAILLAVAEANRYWLMYGSYTFSLVLILAAPGQIGVEAEERGVQILAGIGLLVVGLVVLHALGGWLSKRDPMPELS
jgi:Fusaric acid resistance protein-like